MKELCIYISTSNQFCDKHGHVLFIFGLDLSCLKDARTFGTEQFEQYPLVLPLRQRNRQISDEHGVIVRILLLLNVETHHVITS